MKSCGTISVMKPEVFVCDEQIITPRLQIRCVRARTRRVDLSSYFNIFCCRVLRVKVNFFYLNKRNLTMFDRMHVFGNLRNR